MPNFSPDDFLNDLDRMALFFKKHRLEYVLVGGIALSIWGRPRTTVDLDFLILTHTEDMANFKKSLRAEGWKIDRRWAKLNPLLRDVQVRVIGKISQMDLMSPRDDHDRQLFQRKQCKVFGHRNYYFIGPEDYILQKLKIGRPHDFEDAVTVLERMKGKLDLPYMNQWAKKLHLAKELSYISSV